MQTTIPSDTLISESEAVRVRRLAEAKAGSSERERKAAKKVAQEFESVFVGMMMKSMRETVGKDSLTGGSRGEEIFRSLLDQEYATAFAARGGIGLAPMIEKQLLADPAGGARKQAAGAAVPVQHDVKEINKDGK